MYGRHEGEPKGEIAMITVDVLTAWVSLGAFSAAVDGIFMFRCLTGRDGDDALAMTRATAERSGGVRRWVLVPDMKKATGSAVNPGPSLTRRPQSPGVF